jgi:preprotein translocase subunit SecA
MPDHARWSSLVFRAGVTRGPYPERPEPAEDWLERAASPLVGLAHRRRHGRPGRARRLVAAVEEHGRALSGLPAGRLAAHAADLRLGMRREGLTEELAARSFALVREVAGQTLGLRHFESQLLGGFAMLSGMVAEMETGEGKTLTATLPAATAALAGVPVHVVSVNDYLVARDAEWMGPIYAGLGLRVGTIQEGMQPPERRQAYACDVTYCSNKQLAFDYLRDRIVLQELSGRMRLQVERLHDDQPRTRRLVLRGLHFAIVDEADSVLVDEARTPLIISRTGDTSGRQQVHEDALRLARELVAGEDFRVVERDRRVTLTPEGSARLAELTRPLGGLWTSRRHREELVSQALSALHLFARDRHYLVRDDKVQIVDELTGRVMADRSWERGLHQVIEVKEGCPITGERETIARISYQRFFRRYLRLAGMTGTAREVTGELWSVYRLNVLPIPTNRPLRRERWPDRLFATAEEKIAAIVDGLEEVHRTGRPVLVGTRSVAASEHLGRLLEARGLAHEILNARQDENEAAIVQHAGERGRITVATNMAGRGTDIRLGPGVHELGGLHVVATERHEARRIDRQLCGRCGRQGDPGSFQVFASLEDEVVQLHCPAALRALARRLLAAPRAALACRAAGLAPWLGQVRVERLHARVRRALVASDKRLAEVLAFAGRPE